MGVTFSPPRVIRRGPYHVVGAWHPYVGDDEDPAWAAADLAFRERSAAITERADDLVLGFLYRPHRDDPSVSADVRSCFVGVEVLALPSPLPEGLAATTFSGGEYVLVDCIGDTPGEAAEGVGRAIAMLADEWLPAHGYVEGDACFAASRAGGAPRPPWVETVYIKLERPSAMSSATPAPLSPS